jgi:hypothetical protein
MFGVMIDGAVEVGLLTVAEDTEEVEAVVTLARLRRWGLTGRVVWVLALALTLTFDVDFMDLAFAILAVVAVRETVAGGRGDDPIVAIVDTLLSDEVIAVVVFDPMVAMVAIVSILSLLLSPVSAGADDDALVVAAPVGGVRKSVISDGEAERSNDEPRGSSMGTSSASRRLVPALRIDELEGGGTPISFGTLPSSTSLYIGFLFIFFFFAQLSHCCKPFSPRGLASTPSYEAVPGSSWSGRPSAVRQRGAPRPKSGTEECIASSALWSTGSRGKSCIVRGTPSRRALAPASLMRAVLVVACSARDAESTGTN